METKSVSDSSNSEDGFLIKDATKYDFALLAELDNGDQVETVAEYIDTSSPVILRRKDRGKKRKTKKKCKHDGEDFLDKVIEENLKPTAQVNIACSQKHSFTAFIRNSMEPSYLDGRLELEKNFGKRVLAQANREQDRKGLNVPARTLSLLQKSNLSHWNSNWPLIKETGIYVDQDNAVPIRFKLLSEISQHDLYKDDEILAFRYHHSRSYQEVFVEYALQSRHFDHDRINALYVVNPFNVELCLQMADTLEFQNSHDEAADLIQRAVWTIGRHIPISFIPRNSRAKHTITKFPKLLTDYPENRYVFNALHLYANHLAKKGCFRTALEYLKLILALQDQEYLAVLYYIDAFALKANCLEFVIQLALFKDLLSKPLLEKYPNLAFSAGLAEYKLYKNTTLLEKACVLYPWMHQYILNIAQKPDVVCLDTGNREKIILEIFISKHTPEYIISEWSEILAKFPVSKDRNLCSTEFSNSLRTRTSLILDEVLTRYIIMDKSNKLRKYLVKDPYNRKVYPFDVFPPLTTQDTERYKNIVPYDLISDVSVLDDSSQADDDESSLEEESDEITTQGEEPISDSNYEDFTVRSNFPVLSNLFRWMWTRN